MTDGIIREFILPTPLSYPITIVAAVDGSAWFTECSEESLTHLWGITLDF
jgi:hypothetical protein